MGTAVQLVPAQRRHVELPNTGIAPSIARLATRKWLEKWNLTCPKADDALVTVSEVVTNALRHTWGLVAADLIFDTLTRIFTCEVTDLSPTRQPHLQELDDDGSEEDGRGMFLVNALSDGWGVRRGDDFKIVWVVFEF
jgi:anti-sigma regulatory factor (Ser/Thr protein kinase)